MQWLNEPQQWEADARSLSMFVTPKTDYWRKTHYGFTVDDGPFYHTTQGGEFEVQVKLTGGYKARFDQMGLMLRISEKHWIKAGIEYVEGTFNVSTVVTRKKSDWSVMPLEAVPPFIWIKAVRQANAVTVSYSLDGGRYVMVRMAYFPDKKPLMVGMTAASPDGEGFAACFEEFQIKHLPDAHRLQWLEKNKP